MRLCYLDETGTSALLDPQQPYFILCGLIVSSVQWRVVDTLLTEVNTNAVQAMLPSIATGVQATPSVCRAWTKRMMGTPADWSALTSQQRMLLLQRIEAHLSAKFEVHAVDLFQGNEDFKGVPLADRLAVVDAMLKVAENNDLRLIYACIDKGAHYRKYSSPDPPHELAFMFVAERFENYLASCGEEGMFISDYCAAGTSRSLKSSLRSYQNLGTRYYFSKVISRVIDSVHFVVSHDSPCIQLADVCTYLLLQREKKNAKWATWYRRAGALVDDSKHFP